MTTAANTATNLTAEQVSRVQSAIVETRRILAKEMAYSADLRNVQYVTAYESTLARLLDMLG